MTDTDQFNSQYQRHNDLLAECHCFTKSAVFNTLSSAAISTVTVNFDGEGDSGQIDGMSAHSDGEPHPIPDIEIEIRRVTWGTSQIESVIVSITDAIEELCYAFLSETHDGWENNDGAFGDFTFNVKDRSITLDFNSRFSDSVNFSHTF